jgi:hypothetical protein
MKRPCRQLRGSRRAASRASALQGLAGCFTRARAACQVPDVPRRIALVLVLAPAMLSAAASASAAPALVTNAYPLAGEESDLALAGSATLVGTEAGPDTNEVRSFAPGQAPKVIAKVTLHPESPEFGDSMRFSASTSRILLLDTGTSYSYKGTGALHYEQLASGPLGAPLSSLSAGCLLTPTLDETVSDEEGRIRPHTAIAIDGEVVAYDSFGCVVVRDFASGLQRIIPLEATLDPVHSGELVRLPQDALLRVAGRLIAFRANPRGGEGPSSIVVYDIDAGRELYRVPTPPEQHPEAGPGVDGPTFDLQPDGTLLIADPSSCIITVSTIADPSPRALGTPACYVRRVRNGRALVVAPGPGGGRVLEWTPIEAPAPHIVADLGRDGILETARAEMNQTDVVYALSGCYPRVYRTQLAEPGAPPTLPARCPVRVSPRAMLTPKSLRVRILCPLGCRGTFSAWVGTAKQLRTGKGGAYLGSEAYGGEPARTDYSLAPNQPQTFTLLPTGEFKEHPSVHGLARQLKRKRRLLLALHIETYTPSTEGLSEERARELRVAYATFTRVVVPIAAERSSSRH